MFKPTKSNSIKGYFDNLPAEQREKVTFLDEFIRKTAPSLKPYFAYNMLGYGKFPYKNYKKEMIEWPIVALASRKEYVSLYICSMDGDQYVAEKYKHDLGKVNVGRSCIRIKRVEDLNLKILEKIIKFAQTKPGLITNAKK
jgi:hypothetical protein